MSKDQLYVVVSTSKDVSKELMRIHGIFHNRKLAEKRREELWDKYDLITHIEGYHTMDYLYE